MLEWNRGITIAAPAEAIWPWLVQLGYGRAGWYTPRPSTASCTAGYGGWSRAHPFQPSP